MADAPVPSKPSWRDGLKRRTGLAGLAAIPYRWVVVILGFLAGITGEFLYAFAARPWLQTFASALLFSLAAMLAGGLFGFLFGLPHVDGGTSAPRSPQPPETGAAQGGAAVVTPSTNLQQVADWLTKLILGAGLTQLGRFPHAAYVLFHAMAASIGGAGSESAISVAGGIAVFFAVLGFVVGWIATYFFITPAFRRIERAAEELDVRAARIATTKPEAAASMREASHSLRVQAESIYAAAYARPRSDPTRVPQMDAAITQAAQDALTLDPTTEEVAAKYDSGFPRDREVVLAIMAKDPGKTTLSLVLGSISDPRTDMEQYQALKAALAAASTLSVSDGAQVRQAVQQELTSATHFTEASARYGLAQQLLAKLPPGTAQGV